MPTMTIRIAVLIMGLISFSTQAEELPGFSYIEACRIDGSSAIVRIVYQGGSCETTAGLEPRVELDGTSALVFIPTVSTAEICSMQIIPNYVQKTIGIASDTAELDVTLLSTALEPNAREVVPVLQDGVDCSAVGETF